MVMIKIDYLLCNRFHKEPAISWYG